MSTKRISECRNDQSFIVKLYLLAYNTIQVIGWSYIMFQMVDYYLFREAQYRAVNILWDHVYWSVIIFQNAAALEIIHAVLGLVKSNPIITIFQVLSRMMVVVGVVMANPRGEDSPGVPIALFAWSITEIIRYGYYALNIIKVVPHFVIWLRYTTFIALYPIGVTGELLCFWCAQIYAQTNTIWSVELPNKFNVTFSYLYLLWIVMFLYIPLFPQMYLHMFAQREKILGGRATVPQNKKVN